MKTICILFGGVSSEHEVSLLSAASVLQQIDRGRWRVETVGITKDGRWLHYVGPVSGVADGSWETSGQTCPAILSSDRGHRGLLLLPPEGARTLPVDIVFPVLHGKNGEDGTVQGLCALAGIPCVGSGVRSSALCMDKALAHVVLERAGIPKTKLVALKRDDTADFESLEAQLRLALGYPMFIKPSNAGSSVGVTKVKDAAGLRQALELAFRHDAKVVAEKAVQGREVECSVMGNGEPVASDVLGEITPAAEFYDYRAKYEDDTTGLHVPARVSDEVRQVVRQMAVRAYKALDCAGFARVDFFVRDDDTVILSEINTIPGFTSISMYPKLWEASGVSYAALIDRLVEYAEEEGGRIG